MPIVTQKIPVTPLDAQLGVSQPAQWPAELKTALFGDKPTFAVLDAARVPNLAEMLATSGLDYESLFIGTKADDWREVAPYLVQLTPGAALTRNLFTGTDIDVPWHLWPAAPGIIMRCALDLEALRARLRKCVQPQIASKASVFFRFWDPRFLQRYLATFHTDATEHVASFTAGLTIFSPDPVAGIVTRQMWEGEAPDRAKGPWPHLLRDSGKVRFALFLVDLPHRMAKRFPALAALDPKTRKMLFDTLVDDALALQIQTEKGIEDFCLAGLLLGGSPAGDARFALFAKSPQHELDRTRKMLKLARTIAEGAA